MIIRKLSKKHLAFFIELYYTDSNIFSISTLEE